MSTHIAAEPGQIADTVLFPGDPLRARWIAERFLTDVEQYTTVRNMLGFTGRYAGRRISVQGSGMGQPSLAIYLHELFTEYDVQTVIRVGSAGGLSPHIALRDIVLAMTASTDSNMNRIRFEGLDFAPAADWQLLRTAYDVAQDRGVPVTVGGIASMDAFYPERPELLTRFGEYGALAVEMESNQLYTLAAKFGRRALTFLTVSDHLVTGEHTSAEERESGFTSMAELALETAVAPSR